MAGPVVGVAVGVGVRVAVETGVGVRVGEAVTVAVRLGVGVRVAVLVGVTTGVGVRVGVPAAPLRGSTTSVIDDAGNVAVIAPPPTGSSAAWTIAFNDAALYRYCSAVPAAGNPTSVTVDVSALPVLLTIINVSAPSLVRSAP